MVQTMGLFDEWQAQKDSQYLTLTDYITELAKTENSSIKATLLYLINHKENLKLYKKSIDGNYHKIAQHTTKKRKSLLKQWHNNNFSHEPPLCQTLTDSVKY